MAAGKNGWNCGAFLKMTFTCFICMTLFHSGNALSKEDLEKECQGIKQQINDATSEFSESIGMRLGAEAKKAGGNHTDGLTCKGGIDLKEKNYRCVLTSTNYTLVNAGIEKAGGGTVCVSGKCSFSEDAYLPLCGDPQPAPPRPKSKPSESSNSSQILAMMMGMLIATVMLIKLSLNQVMS